MRFLGQQKRDIAAAMGVTPTSISQWAHRGVPSRHAEKIREMVAALADEIVDATTGSTPPRSPQAEAIAWGLSHAAAPLNPAPYLE